MNNKTKSQIFINWLNNGDKDNFMLYYNYQQTNLIGQLWMAISISTEDFAMFCLTTNIVTPNKTTFKNMLLNTLQRF